MWTNKFLVHCICKGDRSTGLFLQDGAEQISQGTSFAEHRVTGCFLADYYINRRHARTLTHKTHTYTRAHTYTRTHTFRHTELRSVFVIDVDVAIESDQLISMKTSGFSVNSDT